jgi:hypothetical protein
MDKKTIYYIIGGVAILGIGYYFMNKGKKTGSESKDDTEKVDSDTTDKNATLTDGKTKDGKSIPKLKNPNLVVATKVPVPVPVPVTASAPTKLTPQELESKLSSGCGKKPKLKKNKTLWNNCRNDMKDDLKSQGLVAFDGSYSSQNDILSEGFYSDFDNGLDLDL